MIIRTIAIAAVFAFSGGAAAKAQFANMDINALNARMNAQMNAAMNQRTNSIVRGNMSDPRIVAAWRANPRGMSLQQYAYMWGATGGFTPQGMAYFRGNEANNVARERRALAGYRQAQSSFAGAIAQRNAAHSANMQEAGRGLMGPSRLCEPRHRPGRAAELSAVRGRFHDRRLDLSADRQRPLRSLQRRTIRRGQPGPLLVPLTAAARPGPARP